MTPARPSLTLLATLAVAVGGCNPTPPSAAPRVAPAGAFAVPAAAVLRPVPAPVDAAPSPYADPRQTIPFLASDDLAGRMPGTPGMVRAGDYLAAGLAALGLQPLPGHADDFQPFTVRITATLDPATGLAIDDKPLAAGRDYDPVGLSPAGSFRGPVAFAGYGISRGTYDDYAGVDCRGRVVLAMTREPTDGRGTSRFAPPGRAWSDDARPDRKAAVAAAHGAVGLLLVAAPGGGGGPDDVRPFPPEADADATAAVPVVQVSRRVADLLLAVANRPDLRSLQDRIDADLAPRSAPLADVTASGEVVVERSTADGRNVAACLPGAGPRADEWVVVGAHYDHLGTGQLGRAVGPAGRVYPGADDDASGVAAVLELAARLRAAGPLPRSVLFVLFSGTEEGLVGSDHFVRNPPVPLDRVAAMVNLDGVGRLRDDALLVGGAGTAAAFDGIVADAAAAAGLHAGTAGRGGLGPGDAMRFALRRVPVLTLSTGPHADARRPTDTADKINYPGLDRVVTAAEHVVTALAAMPRQTYDAAADTRPTPAPGRRGGRASLGVVPDAAAADAGPAGVPISGVGPGTPAAAAGLAGGDRLVGLGTTDLATLQDLSDALAQARPGDRVDVRVVRRGRPVTLHAVLGERKPAQ